MGWANQNKVEYNFEGVLSFKDAAKFTIRLLKGNENAPIYPFVHNVPQSLNVNGGFTTVLCSGPDVCPLCAVNASAQYKDRPNTATPQNPISKPYPKSTVVVVPVYVKEKENVYLVTAKGIVKRFELWETNGKDIFSFYISAIKTSNNGKTEYTADDLAPTPFDIQINQERLKSLVPGYLAFLKNNMSQVRVLRDTDPEWFPSAKATGPSQETSTKATVPEPKAAAPAQPTVAVPAVSAERDALNKKWEALLKKGPKGLVLVRLLVEYSKKHVAAGQPEVKDTDDLSEAEFAQFLSDYEKG